MNVWEMRWNVLKATLKLAIQLASGAGLPTNTLNSFLKTIETVEREYPV